MDGMEKDRRSEAVDLEAEERALCAGGLEGLLAEARRERKPDVSSLRARLVQAGVLSAEPVRLRSAAAQDSNAKSSIAKGRKRRAAWAGLKVAGLLFVLGLLVLALFQKQPAVYAQVESLDGSVFVAEGAEWQELRAPFSLEVGQKLRAGPKGCRMRLGCGGRLKLEAGGQMRFRKDSKFHQPYLDTELPGARALRIQAGRKKLAFRVGRQVFVCNGTCEIRWDEGKNASKPMSEAEISVLNGKCYLQNKKGRLCACASKMRVHGCCKKRMGGCGKKEPCGKMGGKEKQGK